MESTKLYFSTFKIALVCRQLAHHYKLGVGQIVLVFFVFLVTFMFRPSCVPHLFV